MGVCNGGFHIFPLVISKKILKIFFTDYVQYYEYWWWLQIDTYEKIYEEVELVEGTSLFESWFRVDSKPFKQAVLNIIKRWSYMFKQHLIDHVTNRWDPNPSIFRLHYHSKLRIAQIIWDRKKVRVMRKFRLNRCPQNEVRLSVWQSVPRTTFEIFVVNGAELHGVYCIILNTVR